MNSTIITRTMLEQEDGCEDQLDIFEKEWADGCVVTLENLERAVELNLDISWFAKSFLPTSLLAEFERQIAPLWAEFGKQVHSLRAEFEKQEAPLLAEYQRQKASHWAEFERQIAPLVYKLWQQKGVQDNDRI